MKQELVREIIECLPQERSLFWYRRDYYALWLLRVAAGSGKAVRELKQSRYSGLLTKPLVKQWLPADGRVAADVLPEFCPAIDQQALPFALGLSDWSGDQTSRKRSNLVLQLNFSNEHQRSYQRLLQPLAHAALNGGSHPVAKERRETLAWARLDVNFETNEVLIEEVQSDWLREASWLLNYTEKSLCNTEKTPEWTGVQTDAKRVSEYMQAVLKPYIAIWQEAMLTAAMWFIREELGVKTVWYHSHKTGSALKGIRYDAPPVSLYSQLPKKFCFERTSEVPEMLAQERRCRRTLNQLHKAQKIVPEFYCWQ